MVKAKPTVIEPNKHQKYWHTWVKNGMPLHGITKKNAELIREYLQDQYNGDNVSKIRKSNGKRKAERDTSTLMNNKSKLMTWTKLAEQYFKKIYLPELQNKKKELKEFDKAIRAGKLKSPFTNKPFLSFGTYNKKFIAFWNWYMRKQALSGASVVDITLFLDSGDDKPQFNWLKIEDVKKLCNAAKYEYRFLMMFLFDSGIRAPKELMNVQVSDLEFNEKTRICSLTIKEESSKTFGRKIKLFLCYDLLKEYIAQKKLGGTDYLWTTHQRVVGQYLKRLGESVLGFDKAKGMKNLSYYDFRHSSACYYRPRYKNSKDAMMYRYGWKKDDMVNYYTELLGMHDTLQTEDLYIDISKTELERDLEKERHARELLQERLVAMESKIESLVALIADNVRERKGNNVSTAILTKSVPK